MVGTELRVNQSGTSVGLANSIYFSGTYFAQQGAVQVSLLCALSGLAVIPVRCDSTGRIGSIV